MSDGEIPKPRLTAADLVKQLALNSSQLVDEVYEIAMRQLVSEEKRETNLAAKAVSLLSVTGLSLTVAFTFGGVLLQRPAYLAELGRWRFAVVVLPYVLAIIFGLAAGVFALWALLVRSDYRDVEEHDVFGPELASADGKGEEGPPIYRRFLIAHLWLIYQKTFDIHEDKAKKIAWGQICFFAFLLSLLPIGGAMTYSLAVAREPVALPVPITCQFRLEEQKTSTPPPASSPPATESTTEPAKPAPTSIPSTGRRVKNTTGPRIPQPARPPGSK